MTDSLTPRKLATVFGSRWSASALFYSYDAALRFELASHSHPIERFLSAHTRASRLATWAIADAEDLHMAGVFFSESDKPGFKSMLNLFRGLSACGLPFPTKQAIESRRLDGDDSLVCEFVAPIQKEHVDRVLWAAIAVDVQIEPRVPALLSLVSVSRGVLLHPYDDRGMDVIGSSVDRLRPLYDEFRAWLLDYDLADMRKVFEQ